MGAPRLDFETWGYSGGRVFVMMWLEIREDEMIPCLYKTWGTLC
ncbi:MAG TPA: hypothetical protein VHB45_15060 [Alloacidobacterium sp.]|nr:hypothetical protein [Alloacidobacterium sp.]